MSNKLNKEQEYNKIRENIEKLIEEIETFGVKKTKYQMMFSSILREIELEDSDNNYISMFVFIDYDLGIKKLKELENTLYKDINCFKTETIKADESKIEEVDKCIKAINDNVYIIDSLVKEYKNIENNTNNEKRNIKKRLTALLLSLTLTITGLFILPKIVKSINTRNCYEKSSKTYSLINGLNDNKGYSEVSLNENDAIYIKEYGELEKLSNKKYSREVKIYDVSNIKTNDLNEYLELDLETLNIDYKTSRIETYPNSKNTNIDSGQKEVEQILIDRSTVYQKFDNVMYGFELILAYLIYTSLLMMCEMVGVIIKPTYIGIFNNIINLFKNTDDFYDNNCFEKNYNTDKIKSSLDELLLSINDDEILRTRFDELLIENGNLLNNPDELINRIINLETIISKDDIKKLVKVRNDMTY